MNTHFEFEGNRLIQVIEMNKTDSYPIVADPAWSYSKSYSTGSEDYKTARTLLKKKNNFNKIFPVAGAPSNFPRNGQALPLTVLGKNFNCTFVGEFSGQDGSGAYWGFTFRAAKGHVDGVGSTIRFSFNRNFNRGTNYLNVYAVIQNSKPLGLPPSAYVAGAYANWSLFAINVKGGLV